MTLHDLPPLSAMTDEQLMALLEYRPSDNGTRRQFLEVHFINRMRLGRITEQDVCRALKVAA